MKWFNPMPKTLSELKIIYKTLAFKHHPDCGGQTIDMQQINEEYGVLFQKLKNIHSTADGMEYQSKNETEETAEEFRDIINAIINFQNVIVQIIGNWIWIEGTTYPYKDILRSLKFKWSYKKRAWYYHTEPYKKKYKSNLTLDEIREIYGVKTIETVALKQIAY